MIAVIVILTIVFLADAFRLRGRIHGLFALSPSTAPISPELRFLVAPGVTLDEETRRDASAHARAMGLQVLDLIPGDQPAAALMGLMQTVDPRTYRRDRIASGRTAGYGVVAARDALERARIPEVDPPDAVAFFRAALRLKRHACTATDLVVAPRLRALPVDPMRRRAFCRELFGEAYFSILAVQLALIALIWLGVFLRPGWGLVPLILFHLQPIMATAGSKVRPRDLAVFSLFRSPIELRNWVSLVADRWRPRLEPDPEASRPLYADLLAGGVARYLEPRRGDCPLCGGTDLRPRAVCRDLLQRKPGTFTLEECESCRHVFQNPRLTLDGLGFYYRDFYDGLGGEGAEAIFGFTPAPYRSRAGTVREVTRPKRWLDVGAGHGHFCCVAKELFPGTRFEGLDLAESVEEAVRRGWIDRGHRGLFPDLAPSLAGQFDLVSMSHYLEHTRDPRAELAAANTALESGGHLLIEIPDPDCPLGGLLGAYWLPWFQPQHQHLLNTANLGRLLDEQGFEAVKWVHEEAHLGVDFAMGVVLGLGDIAPPTDLPWLPPSSWMDRALRQIGWTVALPAFGLGFGLDAIYGAFMRRLGGSNAIRVIARKR